MNEIATNQTPKNYWAARMIVFVMALGILCYAISWERVASYLSAAGSNISEFAILWLVGIHCLLQRRLRALACCAIILALSYLVMAVIAYGLEGSTALQQTHATQPIHHIEFRLFSAAMCVASIMLLLLPRLNGWRKCVQGGTAVMLALRLWALYMPFPIKSWSISYSVISGAAYLGIFVTSYFILARREIMQTVTNNVATDS